MDKEIKVAELLGYREGMSFEFPLEINKIYKFDRDLTITKIDTINKVITFNTNVLEKKE